MTSSGSHLSTVWARTTGLEVVSGSGCRVVDTAGVEYLDFTAANAVASTGHAHPDVVPQSPSRRRTTRRRTIRWMPPLVVTAAEVSEALSAFSSAIRATG